MTEKLEQAYEEAKRAKDAAEQMLGFVLLAVGHPVVVPKELLKSGIPNGATIAINDNLMTESFEFSLEVAE